MKLLQKIYLLVILLCAFQYSYAQTTSPVPLETDWNRIYIKDIGFFDLPPTMEVQKGKYKEYIDKLAPLPAFLMGWKVPPRRSLEFNALYLAGKLLYGGDSARLYQKLVKGEESVTQLFGFTDERRGPSGIIIGAIPKPDKDLEKIREVIVSEIRDMAANGPTEDEMAKLRNQLINLGVRSNQSSLSRAQNIAEYALYDGDPNLVNSEIETLLEITADQIRDAVDKYLNTENRSLLDIVPASEANQ